MAAPGISPLVVDYAPVDVGGAIPFIRPMRVWRAISAWSLFPVVLALICLPYPTITIGGEFIILASAAFTLTYMSLAGAHEVGVGYAARHICVALILSPFFLLGIWIVPLRVESDLVKRRSAMEQHWPEG